MTLCDCRGEPISSTSAASLARLEHATTLTASYFVDPLAAIEHALAEEPDFIMGHCLRMALVVMSSEKAALPMLADSLAAIERRAQGANQRERAHAAAARAWLQGDFAGSVRLYGDILLDHPRDLIALQTAHIGDFLLGQSQMLRDRVAQVLPAWNADVPGYGYVLGMYAFGLEETGSYARAEEVGRQALAHDALDPWSVHAVAHVMEMQGRVSEGIAWLTGRQGDWAQGNGLACHNWWHVGLFHLDLGQHDRVLDLYDRCVHPRPTPVIYENVDASALLWRLTLRGIDVGARWQALAEVWQPVAEDGFYAFNDAHAVMAFVGAGREDLVARTLAAMERGLDAGRTGTNVMMIRDVGLPLAQALAAFGQGRYDDCVERLLWLRGHTQRFGGSHAQRDVVHLTLLESALRAGRRTLAQALAADRTELRPQSPHNRALVARAAAG